MIKFSVRRVNEFYRGFSTNLGPRDANQAAGKFTFKSHNFVSKTLHLSLPSKKLNIVHGVPYQGQHQISRAVSTLPSEEKQTLAPPMCQCGVPKIVRVVSCCFLEIVEIYFVICF